MDILILLETLLFTVSLAVPMPHRRGVRDLTPALPTTTVQGVDEPFLLIAFDQRRNGTTPSSWQAFIPSVYEIANNVPVKVLVAPDNIAIFDRLLDEPIRRLGTERYRLEYVSYHSRVELRSLVLGARFVVTDLPHVAAWAKDLGKDSIDLQNNGVRWSVKSSGGNDVLSLFRQVVRAHDTPSRSYHPAELGALFALDRN